MPDITYDYNPATGDQLTAAGLNGNLYQTTAGKSIYETTNGNLEFLNFDPAFKIQGYQVRPFQAGGAISVGRTPSNDYFSDIWTGDGVGYVPVAGCAVTFFSEYDVTMAMFSVSGFVSMWRQFGADGGAWATRLASPDISIRTFFGDTNGNITTHTYSQRDMPQTVFLNPASGNTGPGPPAWRHGEISTVEQRLTRHYNLSHPRMTDGASPCGQLLSGEHTFGLAVLVKRNLSGQDDANPDETWRLYLNSATSPDARPSTNYSAVQRARFYCRNVTAVKLL